MARVIKYFITLCVCFFALSLSCYASDVKFDISNASNGIVLIDYQGTLSTQIKVLVVKDKSRYIYTIKSRGIVTIPLQLGSGFYQIQVLEEVELDKFGVMASVDLDIKNIDEVSMFSVSNIEIDLNTGTEALSHYTPALDLHSSIVDKVKALYNDIVAKYKYDYSKIVPSEYTPSIDDMFKKKLGICFDYSVLFAGILRDSGISVKLVMGYSSEVEGYHAWNEIYVDGAWYVFDLTFDSVYFQAGKIVDMVKDSTKYVQVKVY